MQSVKEFGSMRNDSAVITDSLVQAYKKNNGSARRAREIEASEDPLALLVVNVQKRGAGASSKTYLGYQEHKISQFLSQERMNSHEEETLVKFLQVLYRDMGGSKKRADEIFYKSSIEKKYRSLDEIIQKLFLRAICDRKGASNRTLRVLNQINCNFFQNQVKSLLERLPEGSASDPSPGFFQPKTLTRKNLRHHYEPEPIQPDVKPVVASAVTM